jgi:ATP-binding cassette subfamily C protein CydCD
VVRGLATLRLYGRAERQIGVVAAMTDQHRGATMRVLRVAFLSSTALDLLGTLSVGLIAVEAGLRVAGGSLGLAPALLVILLAPEVYRPLREMAARYHASTEAGAVIADVDEVLTAPPGPAAPAARAGPAGVVASGLRVRYLGSTMDALGLDPLVAPAGRIVVLRGPSGAGKTTALRVFAGLQPADCGVVEVRGPRPLYLPQRPVLPHARSVADAFGLGGGGSLDTIRAALRAVGLDGEVGPDTPLGEHGGGVSAGQRQRVALAVLLCRARREPVTLLLDEPTAHLDAPAERLVIAELRAAAERGCAVIAVAHRPALVAAADTIVDVRPPAPGTPDTRPITAAAGEPEKALPGETAGSPRRRWATAGSAAALGGASWLAGVVLTGAAAWLLVRASALPPVLTLSAAVVLVRASAVARPLLRYLERLVSHDVAFARLGARRAAVYAGLIPRVPGPAPDRRGTLLTRVVDDVDAQVDGLLRGRLPAVSAALALGVASVAGALVVPAIGLPLGAGLVVAGALAPVLAVRQATRREAATARARAELRDAVVETVDGLEEQAGNAAGPAALAVPDRRSRVLARLEAQAAAAAGSAAGLAHLGWGVAVAGTAVVLGHTGGLSQETAAVLLLAVVALAEPVLALPDAAIARHRGTRAAQRLAPDRAGETDEPGPTAGDPEPDRAGETDESGPTAGDPEADQAGAAGQAGATAAGGPAGAGTGLAIRGLVAGWDRATAPVLNGLDLTIGAGQSLAVLGRSGSGKSTLAAVLAGFLEPRAGTVTFDGRALADLPPGTVGLVSDDADHLFATTLRENLRLARPDATDDDLAGVLDRVGLTGWGDRLGEWLGAGGTTVSGGQRRRLGTARALLADPRLLILDEPTEGLDEPAAEALMADLLAAAGSAGAGRTVLLLTHRTEGLHCVGGCLALTTTGA